MRNAGKKIHLITKHDGDLLASLDDFKICHGIFDEIIHIKKSDDKADYINNVSSIFIDDSFNERRNVSRKLGIPSFSVDVVGMFT